MSLRPLCYTEWLKIKNIYWELHEVRAIKEANWKEFFPEAAAAISGFCCGLQTNNMENF